MATPDKFYKGRSQEKTHLLRLEFFLLRSPLDRGRSVLTYRAMCSVAGPCDPVVWVFSTSGFHRLFAIGRLPSDPDISSIKTSTMITSSNSLRREWDAHSSAQASTSHHVRYRAVPRTNRTRTTASTHNHSATSSTSEPPASAPSLPWQCSCADAPPGECTDVATPD
jgi:hypothetical protein